MALPLRRKTHESVVFIDENSAPRLMPFGEDLISAELPADTRVIYPNAPIKGLPNREAAIRYALNHPIGQDPLYSGLEPGKKVTIVTDGVSSVVPMPASPDVRETMLRVVVDLCAATGVDDINIIVAGGLDRKMTAAEMRQMAGREVFNEFYPERFYCHDAEDEDAFANILGDGQGRAFNVARRMVESDLIIYLNAAMSPNAGGFRGLLFGLSDHATIKNFANFEQDQEGLTEIGERLNEIAPVFCVGAALNNRIFDESFDLLSKNEDELTFTEKLKVETIVRGFANLPRAAKRTMISNVRGGFEMIGCFAGDVASVQEKVNELLLKQLVVPIKDQADILITGVGSVSPFSINSIMNPVLVQTLVLGGQINAFTNKPILKQGGVVILTHPLYDEFDHRFHPSYIEFFHRLLAETRDAAFLREKYEMEFATNPAYIEMYRRGNAFHGAHPFYAWYMAERGRHNVGKVIVAGAENAHVPELLGWDRADNVADAVAMARSFVGRDAEITMLHQPMNSIFDVS